MTTLSGLTHEEVLRELKAAGLGSLPGGGAEIFADRVRQLVAPGKEHPDFWFARTTPPTAWGSPRTARCCTATSRPTRSASTTSCGCATSRTRPAASWPSSRSPSIPRTRCSNGAASGTRPGADDLKMLASQPPHARQRAEHQGVLDHDGHAAGRRRAPLRRERRAGHRRARDDLSRRRGAHGDGAEGRAARPLRAGGRAHPRPARHAVQRDPALG